MKTIAFIGLGNMGAPMATQLIEAGFSVRVYDLVESQKQALAEKGAYSAENAFDAVEGASCVISMLQKGCQVLSLFLGAGGDAKGLLDALTPKSLVIDCSTVDKPSAMQLHEACANADMYCLDAPVSGGVAAAQAGSLTFMCGGAGSAFELGHPVLSSMGQNIFHAGPAGSGQVAKMCNNMLLAIHMIGSSEALHLGLENGLDASVLSDIMLASSGANWSLQKYNPCPDVMPNVPASNQYQPGFMVDLMVKDLELAMANAQSLNRATPLGQKATELFKQKQNAGDGKLDFSSIFDLIKSIA